MNIQSNKVAGNSNRELRMYEIYKGFNIQVIEPESYLVKTIGIDCDQKKQDLKKKKICIERFMIGHKNFFYTCFESTVFKKRKRRRRTLKRKRHEELEEAV